MAPVGGKLLDPTSWRRQSFAFVLVALLFVSPGAKGGVIANARGFVMRTAEAGSWIFEYNSHEFSPAKIEIDGKPHLLFSSSTGTERGTPGTPQLPVELLSLGVPFESTIGVELLNPVYETVRDQWIAPVPLYKGTGLNENIAVFRKDPAAYSQSAFLPIAQVQVGTPFTLRQQRISVILLFPFQYNPVTRDLKKLVKANLRVFLKSDGSRSVPASGSFSSSPDPQFEPIYRSLLANFEQAKQWRRVISTFPQAPVDSTRLWFETGKTYYRIPITLDGWYRLSRDDLLRSGIPPSSIDLASVRFINRGKEVPVLIRPDSTIEFYGVRKRGDSTYFDYWTDTNIYWLTSGGGKAGLRFSSSPQPVDSGTVRIVSAPRTRHFEVNALFYRGATQNEIIEPGPVPGKDWVWEYYFPNTITTHVFQSDSVDALNHPLATLRVRLFGTTSGSPPVSHRARFWINDSLVGECSFGQRQEGMFNATFPSTLLHAGDNVISVQSIDTQTSPNQFYLDWFEIGCQEYLRAEHDQLVFTSPPSQNTKPVNMQVSGFVDPLIEVFDLDGSRSISGGVVSGDPTAGYSVSFRDTSSGPRNYLVISKSGGEHVPSVIGKTFADIRTNPQGADYIIVTHRDFLTAAQVLANHRLSVNKLRTAVIDVRDVYDEFNYGIFNGETIKAFLLYAYSHWRSPAPSSVLLFGDASYDDHHYFSATRNKDFVPSYGVPTTDNWFACFDSVTSFLPSLLVGRLNVQDSVQAMRTVEKVTRYDQYTPGAWDKRFLFLTGGADPAEQSSFNALTEQTISSYVSTAPIGGVATRFYKTSTAPIDSSLRTELQGAINDGALFVNFLGHSAGNIWSLDVGSPAALANTNNQLPFVSSVSCNVSSFADQTNENLSEQFTLAEDRGAIAMWGCVSLGFAFTGQTLSNLFLSTLINDSTRGFGALTTVARIKLWQIYGSDNIVVAMMKLTPLLGDPLSQLALPLQPDLAVFPEDVTLDKPVALLRDSSLAIKVRVHNFGLVPSDSVGISLEDLSGGGDAALLSGRRLPPTLFADSLLVPWYVASQTGKHTLTVNLDPAGIINEVNKANNAASVDEFVYDKLLAPVRPIRDQVVPAGPITLITTDPPSTDSAGFRYVFQIDTVDTFDSPFLISSPQVTPGPVGGQWLSPPLVAGHLYFWRARTQSAFSTSNWMTSSFVTSSNAPALPVVRWMQGSRKQFSRDALLRTVATDSGLVRVAGTPTADVGSVLSAGVPFADSWKSFRWKNTTSAGLTDASAVLLGVRVNGFVDTLRVIPHDSTSVSLASLAATKSAVTYATLRPGALLSTKDSTISPVVQELALDFEPPADLAISNRTVGTPNLSVPKGTTVNLPVTVYNIGYRKVDSARVEASMYDNANVLHSIASAEVDGIAPDGSRTLTLPIPTSGLSHLVTLVVTVTPANGVGELVRDNNSAITSFTVTGNPDARVQFFADGTQIMDGDYIASVSTIVIRPPADGGTTAPQRTVELYVDNKKVGTTLGKAGLTLLPKEAVPSGDPTFSVALANGSHELKTLVIQPNISGPSDSLEQRVTVNVLNEYRILRVFNYPNPFRTETQFTFVLTGSQSPEEVNIRIFTVAGRKIGQISLPPGTFQIGFNHVTWDGRDNDGDEVANGYYFYQVQVKGEGKVETAIGKLVKVR